VRIYSYDVDFRAQSAAGDSFDVLYSNARMARPAAEVRYAALSIGGETKRYYRFQTPTTAFTISTTRTASATRNPGPQAGGDRHRDIRRSAGARIRCFHISGTAYRRRLGAPFGTRSLPPGNGEIEEIGLKGGYGKYVRAPPRQRL